MSRVLAFHLNSFTKRDEKSFCGIQSKACMEKTSFAFIPSNNWFNHLDHKEYDVIAYYNEIWC